ncbi:MAG: right-handed parallel beta-helix repeat-containing protein [Nanoarchaeota archaeon]
MILLIILILFVLNITPINAQINTNLQLKMSTISETYRVGNILNLDYQVINTGADNINARLEVKVRFPNNDEHDLMPSIVWSWNNDFCCGEPQIRIGNTCEQGRYVMRYKTDYYCCKKPAKVPAPLPNCPYTDDVTIPPNADGWRGTLFTYKFRNDDNLQDGEYSITTRLKNQNGQDIVTPSVVRFGKITLPTITLTSCQEITQSGNYVLDRDLSSTTGTCLNVHDTNDVYINCNGHSITSGISDVAINTDVTINNIRNFKLNECTLKTTGGRVTALLVSYSDKGVISRNRLHATKVFKSSNIQIKDNYIETYYQQEYSSGNIIENNDVSYAQSFDPGGLIISIFGSNNKIINNRIDGRSDGDLLKQIGADDGIVLGDETEDIIQNNLIKNHYDCGIETLGFISKTQISNNNIKNNGLCGIGGWYWNSWKDNLVSQNIIEDSPHLFNFALTYGLRPRGWDTERVMPQDEYRFFKDNIFSNNKFINPKRVSNTDPTSSFFNLQYFGGLSQLSGERVLTQNELILGNNIFTNNDFGITLPAPYLKPESMIVDGGGNICSQPTEANYPLRCR